MTNPSTILFRVSDDAKRLFSESRAFLISKLKLLFRIITADGELWQEQFIFVDLFFLYVTVAPCLMIGCV